MIEGIESIRVIDVLYRVSTRAQEKEGESLYNQRRSVETEWAEPRGIRVRRRVEVAESGKSALRLRGAGFEFSRRAEYRDMILQYQRGEDLPDAVCVDWSDRWSRSMLEFVGIIAAFRSLGIRLLAIGEGIDLTDPRTHLVSAIKSAVAQEQVRITSDKVRESRRSRRERARWQGGTPPDGYRMHVPDCGGLISVRREAADGTMREFKVRGCGCPVDILYRDPKREATITAILKVVHTSPLSWQGMADAVNDAGYRRPNGGIYRWEDLYRIGENPHYAGVMATHRWIRNPADGYIKRKNPLREQELRPSNGTIVDPYIKEDDFWNFHELRYNLQTRYLRRAPNGSQSELTGLLYCPSCDRPMVYKHGLSSKICGNGKPRKSPRKKYIYAVCKYGRNRRDRSCGLYRTFRADKISLAVLERIAAITSMSDAAIVKALSLKTSEGAQRGLHREMLQLRKEISEADETRRFIQRERANNRMTEEEYERDLFSFRRETESKRMRLRDLERSLQSKRSAVSFAKARQTLTWLREHWTAITVPERAEALRLLVRRVSLREDGSPVILAYGAGLVEGASDVRLGLAQ